MVKLDFISKLFFWKKKNYLEASKLFGEGHFKPHSHRNYNIHHNMIWSLLCHSIENLISLSKFYLIWKTYWKLHQSLYHCLSLPNLVIIPCRRSILSKVLCLFSFWISSLFVTSFEFGPRTLSFSFYFIEAWSHFVFIYLFRI